MKMIMLAALPLILAGCGMFESTIVRKDIVEPYTEYIQCQVETCGKDGFIEVRRPTCYRLGFSDLGGEILECVPKKVWDRTELGEVWHSDSMREKSQ